MDLIPVSYYQYFLIGIACCSWQTSCGFHDHLKFNKRSSSLLEYVVRVNALYAKFLSCIQILEAQQPCGGSKNFLRNLCDLSTLKFLDFGHDAKLGLFNPVTSKVEFNFLSKIASKFNAFSTTRTDLSGEKSRKSAQREGISYLKNWGCRYILHGRHIQVII